MSELMYNRLDNTGRNDNIQHLFNNVKWNVKHSLHVKLMGQHGAKCQELMEGWIIQDGMVKFQIGIDMGINIPMYSGMSKLTRNVGWLKWDRISELMYNRKDNTGRNNKVQVWFNNIQWNVKLYIKIDKIQ